ncbi:MAG: SAF domain-containing protein [Acidobacteriota bacterium]|nr:SAF domain-containing protein [Acidobacteriota bacterium]
MNGLQTAVKRPQTDKAERASKEPAKAQDAIQAVSAPPRARRRPVLMLAAAAMVLLGSALSVWAYSSLGSAQEVLAVRVDVARGAVITAESLHAVRVGVDPALQVVPVVNKDALVGRRAAVDLKAGQLLVPQAVSDDVFPHAGLSVVGLTLGSGQMPGTPLLVGDQVRIVSTLGAQGQAQAAEIRVFAGKVVGVSAADTAGQVTISVELPVEQAPEVAVWAASGNAAVVLESREG